MKKIIKKTGKGLVGVFCLKILLFSFFLFIQSCQEGVIPQNQFDENAIERYQSFVHGGILRNSSRSTANLETTDLTDQGAKKLLSEFTQESIIFLRALGFDNEDINSELGGADSPTTAAIAYILLQDLNKNNYQVNNASLNQLVFNQAYAGGEIKDCILHAFGFAAVGYVLQFGIEEAIEHYGKKGLIKVLGKAAGRTLGWVGLAIAAYEFADCMAEEVD